MELNFSTGEERKISKLSKQIEEKSLQLERLEKSVQMKQKTADTMRETLALRMKELKEAKDRLQAIELQIKERTNELNTLRAKSQEIDDERRLFDFMCKMFPDLMLQTSRRLSAVLAGMEWKPLDNPFTEDQMKMMDMSVDQMELTVRSSNCLKNANIRKISDLMNITENDLIKTRSFGKKSFLEIKEKLKVYGLSIGMAADNGMAIRNGKLFASTL